MTYQIEEPFKITLDIKHVYLNLSIETSLVDSILLKIKSLDPDTDGSETPPFTITPEAVKIPPHVLELRKQYGEDAVRDDGSLITPPGDSPPPYAPLTP